MRPDINPYARGFRVEDHIDRGRTKEARRARDIEVEARARETVRTVLDGCEDGLRADLSLALIDATAEAASDLHDPETIQARLGRVAHERGAALPAKGLRRTASAEVQRVFGGRAA